MPAIVAFAMSYVAFLFFALMQRRPRQLLFGRAQALGDSRRRLYQLAGTALLLLSFLLVMSWEGWSFGIIVWGTIISVAACSVSFTLTWQADRLGKLLNRLGPADRG